MEPQECGPRRGPSFGRAKAPYVNRATFILGLGSAITAAATPARSDTQLDQYMAPHVAMAEFRGVVGIAPKGTTETIRAFGGSFDGDSRFRVASVAKGFTAATVAALVENDKLEWDARLGNFLPAFSSTKITIRQLLSHDSGIPDIYSLPEFARGHRDPISKVDYIALLASAKPQFEPGTSNAYSNSGYTLLAFAIEAITESPFAAAQRRLVLDPAGLQNTDVLPGAGVVQGADPGAPNATRSAEPLDSSWLIGNGSLYTTVADLQKWLAEIVAGASVRARKWTYPWGWGRRSNGKILDGDGRYSGFACDAQVDLDSGDSVVVLSSIQSAVVNVIARDLVASIGGADLKPVEVRTFAKLNDDAAAQYAGSYRLSSDFSVSVLSSDGAMQIAGPDSVPESLDPLGDDRFYFRVLDTELRFKRGATGEVGSIDWGPGAFTLVREKLSSKPSSR
jgi:CubicO group peptidase (beta-lactamase class C family)